MSSVVGSTPCAMHDLAGRRGARRRRHEQGDDRRGGDLPYDHAEPPRTTDSSRFECPLTLGAARRRVKVRERLVARGDEPEGLGLARPLEKTADRGTRRQAEPRHDVRAPEQRRRVGAGAAAPPSRAAGHGSASSGARSSGATSPVTAAASTSDQQQAGRACPRPGRGRSDSAPAGSPGRRRPGAWGADDGGRGARARRGHAPAA